MSANAVPFLRLPPFPGHRAPPLARARSGAAPAADLTGLVEKLREAKVGGEYWLPAVTLPEGSDIVLAPTHPGQVAAMVERLRNAGLEDRAIWLAPANWAIGDRLPRLQWPANPWSVAAQADEVWAGPDHELAAVAAIAGTRLLDTEGECFEPRDVQDVDRLVLGWDYFCPYSGSPISLSEAIDLLAGFRSLIEANRQIAAVLGVAAWKRPTVDPLLWDGASGPRHASQLPDIGGARPRIAVWKSRTSKQLLDELRTSSLAETEVEDGMIRGIGLGANCVPPLSIVVDHAGIYFDPAQPSDLEQILESTDFDHGLLERAARLRARIVELGISKYGDGLNEERQLSGKRQILVVGQVEDDRSILSGGGGQTNLELLERARSVEPDAWLIYRPHPDVDAGHRKGHLPDDVVLGIADEIDRGGSIGCLIDAVGDIHCITSLTGFEALLRGKPVTTHGVPFYAGWGLTRDLGQVPARRTRRRSLDELVAATLILYPRYIDPVTRLPCQPETLVERMARGEASIAAPLSGMRILQGRLKLAVRRLREAVA